MNPLRISAKHLGALAMPDHCERCTWLNARMGWKMPWQFFPGIFSSFDSYSKKVTAAHFKAHGKLPKWLDGYGTPMKAPHWSKFGVVEPESNLLLCGAPDEILRRESGDLSILDYKCAKFTDGQDRLKPLYEVQLNAYAWIAEQMGMGRATRLALVYYEPLNAIPDDEVVGLIGEEGFGLRFGATVVPVEVHPESIPTLLNEARRIIDLPQAPDGRDGCKDCKLLDGLLDEMLDDDRLFLH
jgi:hypothetical protein